MNRFISLLLLAAAAISAVADRLYIEDFTIIAGTTVSIPLLLDNELSYTAFQVDVTLPAELSVDESAPACGFKLTDRKGSHLLNVNHLAGSVFRIVSYSAGLDAYSGNSGALLTVDVTANAASCDTAAITLGNIRFTTQAAVEYSFDDQACIVTIVPMLGDVNGDGALDITDVVVLIDYLLDDNNPIIMANADVNGDGDINIKDVTALIDLLL